MNGNQFIWLFFSFSGRVSRGVYCLASVLVGIAQIFPYYRSIIAPAGSETAEFWASAFMIVLIASFWPHVALSAKRFHDFNRETIYTIGLFIPLVSIVVFFVLCFYPGDKGPNKFGRLLNSPA